MTKKELEKYLGRATAITWVDSTHHQKGWWFYNRGEIEENVEVKIDTVGYIVDITKYSIVLSHSMAQNGFIFDSFVIPIGCIIEINECCTSKPEKDKNA